MGIIYNEQKPKSGYLISCINLLKNEALNNFFKVKNLKYIVLILVLTACKGGNPKTDIGKIEVIDISSSYNNEKKVLLSEVANEIEYIKLQTDTFCIINRIKDPQKNIQFDKEYIFINDGKQLFRFNRKGKFINKIGVTGRGPNERISLDNYTLLPHDSIVVLFSHPNREAFLYSYNNKFISSIKIDFMPVTLASLDNEFLVFGSAKGRRNYTDYYTLSIIGKNGKLVNNLINSKWEKKVEKKDKIGLSILSQFYNYYDTLTYWEFQYDTIWRVSNENVAFPRYYINSGHKKLPFKLLLESSQKEISERDKYIKIWSIVESKRFLFLKVGYEKRLKHILYDKQTKESFNVIYYADDKIDDIKILNDIDGGMPFWPIGNVSGNKVFTYFDGFKYKESLKENDNANDSQKTFTKIISMSEMSDNPIIMIVTLKE